MATIQEAGATIARNQLEFNKLGVVTVRPGYKLDTGWPVGDPIIVIFVSSQQLGLSSSALPTEVEGVPVGSAGGFFTSHLLRAQTCGRRSLLFKIALDEELHLCFPGKSNLRRTVCLLHRWLLRPNLVERRRSTTLAWPENLLSQSPQHFSELTCHASPDAGWPTLKDFFSRIEDTLTVGMYDLTSAHVLQALDAALSSGEVKPLTLVLDDPKKKPYRRSDGFRIRAARPDIGRQTDVQLAAVRSSPMTKAWIFPSAYHIKVAVRDSKEIWLSRTGTTPTSQTRRQPSTRMRQRRQPLSRVTATGTYCAACRVGGIV